MSTLIRRSKVASENQEQKAIVKWLRLHPVLKNSFCKIDNEGKRSVIAGYQSKMMGLRPGVSDLFIYYPTSRYHGLWLEVKRNMKYSKSYAQKKTVCQQREFIEHVRSLGYKAEFCFGFDHAKQIIEDYLRQ